jgi:hypothetical protein
MRPYVSCERPEDGRSVIYYLFDEDELDVLNASFEFNVPAGRVPGDCADGPGETGTYQLGGIHGRIDCSAADGSGHIAWTDETNFVSGQISPTLGAAGTYAECYELWQTAVQISPP